MMFRATGGTLGRSLSPDCRLEVALMVCPPHTYTAGKESQGGLLWRATQGQIGLYLSSDQVLGVRWACVDIFKLKDSVSPKDPNS